MRRKARLMRRKGERGQGWPRPCGRREREGSSPQGSLRWRRERRGRAKRAPITNVGIRTDRGFASFGVSLRPLRHLSEPCGKLPFFNPSRSLAHEGAEFVAVG